MRAEVAEQVDVRGEKECVSVSFRCGTRYGVSVVPGTLALANGCSETCCAWGHPRPACGGKKYSREGLPRYQSQASIP